MKNMINTVRISLKEAVWIPEQFIMTPFNIIAMEYYHDANEPMIIHTFYLIAIRDNSKVFSTFIIINWLINDIISLSNKMPNNTPLIMNTIPEDDFIWNIDDFLQDNLF